MSWFSNLVEAYDRVAYIAGSPDEADNVLLPQNHMAAKTDICVTLDGSGAFRRAEASKLRIAIPCTEDSSGRTSGIVPHPLHEQLSYLAMDEEKCGLYLAQLAAWSSRNVKAAAVYQYVLGGTLPDDLEKYGIHANADKSFVRFRVEIPGDDKPNLWEDEKVSEAWRAYCAAQQSGKDTLCYVTGRIAQPATKHPKGINPSANGAKLISCNDETNYTYRGRFTKPEQANAISLEASHKAHAMLSYLIATQGYKCDSQAIVAWAVDDGHALPSPLVDTFGIFKAAEKTNQGTLLQAQGKLAADYAKMLRTALDSMGNAEHLGQIARRVAVMAVDAATTGRMGITFYQDLTENEYIERVVAWHQSCCWRFWRDGHEYISAPSVDSIIAAVYGEPNGEGYVKIKKQARERLLHCIVRGAPLDRAWMTAAVTRVSHPSSYSKQTGSWDKGTWENAVRTACAIVRKYYGEEEDFQLELDTACTDRDYLFGRLLALADRLESHARYLQLGRNDTEKRPTNAVRYMSAFTSKPLRTWTVIIGQLHPYMMRLDGAEWYQRQIDEVKSLIGLERFTDKPLSGKYLMGYSLQRRALYTKTDAAKREEEETSNESEQEN